MKHLFISLACMAGILSSCSNAEELTKGNPEYIGKGEALVRVTLKSSSAPSTYAGDEAYGTLAAFKEENEVKSIAFFAKIGSSTELKHYMSTEDDGSELGLIDGLVDKDEPAGGIYEARFKLKGVNDDQTPVDFYAIANYEENGIDLSKIVNEEDLENIAKAATVSKSDNPSLPLVMSAVETRKINNGEPTTIEFKLKRLVARIDVVNMAKDANFELKSARIINGKTQSYFLPDMLEINVDAITVADFATSKMPQAGTTRIDSLYTYENLNSASTPATKVEVEGIYNNTAFRHEVEFLKRNPAGLDTIVSILRNNLYTIYIRPNADSTKLNFEVTATDWVVADTFNIQASQKRPVLSDIDATALAGAGMNWDADTKTIDITAATAGANFSFMASGNQDSKIVVKYRGTASIKGTATGATWMEGNIESTPLQGYASSSSLLSRVHTLKIPHLTGTTPSDAFIFVQNASNKEANDTIFIKYRPNYPGTTHKSVLVGGIFWAPVNVGATEIPTAVTAWTRDSCGQLYQFGRNRPFDQVGVIDTLPGPVAYNTIQDEFGVSNGVNKDKYIIASTTVFYSNDWLDYASDPEGYAIRNAIWSPEVNISPCPVGWKVPSADELQKIVRAAVAADGGKTVSGMLTTPSDTEIGTNLIMPAAGFLNNDGIPNYIAMIGYYWGNSVRSEGSATYLEFYRGISVKGLSMTRAAYIRCVQE